MPNMTTRNQPAKPRFGKGQKVIIRPVSEAGVTERENSVSKYAGQVGRIANFYWISPRTEQIFYIYKVNVGKESNRKEIVVYEDELEPAFS